MNEESYRRWDISAKFIAPILTVAGILVGIWQFTTEQSAQLQRQRDQLIASDKAEFKRRTWEKQVEVYSKISNIAGRIAAFPDKNNKAKFAKEVDEFNNLYWGDLIYVKDETVEKATIDFHLEIEDFLKGNSDEDRLKIRANELVEACRKSSKENWFIE